MPPAPDKDAKIPCPTPQHLQIELDALMAVLELREQEDTWEKMERAIIRFTGITRGGGYKHLPHFIDGMGKMGVGLKLGQCMLSDRGRLSGVATELLQTLAPRLGPAFQPLVPVYLAPLVQLLGRPNKVFLKRAEKCLWTILSNCHLPSILVELKRGLSDEAATCRRGCAAGFERALIDWERGNFGEKGVGIVEEALRKVGADKDPEVRATGKRIWTKFSEIWPERVDEFSGPLTPTIRRYLGVSAAASAQAGPSKPRTAPVRPPPARPPAALSASTSSVSTAAPPPPPPAPSPPRPVQMAPPPPPAPVFAPAARAQVLGGRAVRPPLLTTQSEALPPHYPAEPPRPRRSPIRQPFPGGPAMPSSDMAEAPRNRILSSRAPRYPPGVLGVHGRSVSHSVLPLPELSFPSEPELHHMDPPARPAFPTSFSTTSLPMPTSEEAAPIWQPTRRFGDNARPARPGLLSSTSEMHIDALASGPSRPPPVPATPSVLRGAVRSTQAPPAKRDLGQAQRRVVTAPNPESYTPQVPLLGRSTSVRDRIVEMERKAAEVAEVEAREVPLPISPVGDRFAQTGSRSGTPSKLRVEQREAVSPMMPMLARSVRGEAAVLEVKEEMLMDEEISERSVGDVTLGEAAVKATAEGRKEEMGQAIGHVASEPNAAALESPSKLEQQRTATVKPSPTVPTRSLTPTTVPADLTPAVQLVSIPLPVVEPSAPKATSSTASKPPTSTALPAAELKSRKPPLPPVAPTAARRVPAAAAAPAERLPPVSSTTARAAKPRLPANEPRKPFRPTTKATLPPVAASKPAPVAATTEAIPREPAVRSSKPPIPPKAPLPRVVSGAKPPPASSAATKPPPPAAGRVVSSGSNLTKPTASSQHRAAPPAAAAAKPRVLSATSAASSSTLPPPVKKDKVKRKAAVPSFRPTRTTESTVGKGTTSLSASTASLAPVSQRYTKPTAGAWEIVAKVKVRPEAVALPLSPGENRAKEIPLPISPEGGVGVMGKVEEFTGRVKVKPRPASLELAPPPLAREGEERVEEQVSPLAARIPLPLSPTIVLSRTPSPTSAAVPTRDHSPTYSPVDKPPSSSHPSPTQVNSRLPPPQTNRTPLSKASTVPAGSDWAGSDSEDEELADQGEKGRVTFAKTGPVDLMGDDEEEERDLIEFSAPAWPALQPLEMVEGEEKDLIEFSAPSRPAEGIENSVKPQIELAVGKGSVGKGELGVVVGSPRVVLSERDRNGVLRVEELI